MAKILQVSPEKISIGMDNGGIEDVPSDSLNFVPRVGDEVDVFKTGTKNHRF